MIINCIIYNKIKMNADESYKNVKCSKTIDDLVKYEKTRYKRKGYGFVVALIINLLFFQFFPRLINNLIPDKIYNPGKFYAIFVFIVHEISFILVQSYFFIIYYLNLPFFEKYKTTSNPWPWQENYGEFKDLFYKTIKSLAVNHLIILPIALLPNYYFDFCEFNLNKSELPGFFEVIFQVLGCVIVDDLVFYLSHRLLHTKYFYQLIHKQHHEYKHTISLSSEYANPIEYLIGNLLPSSVFPFILNYNMHFTTYITWLVTITFESSDGHSGYDFSWSPHRIIPLNIGAEYHYFHHLQFTGNYSSEFYHWDYLFDTLNEDYLKYYTYLEEKEKEN